MKAVAKPLYDRLNESSPAWVAGQLEASGLILNVNYFADSRGFFYPWKLNTPVAENYKTAAVGQIKIVYALRFNQNVETIDDGIPDLWEYQIINANPNDDIRTLADVTPEGDFDGDGVSNLAEYQSGSDPTTSSFFTDSMGFTQEYNLRYIESSLSYLN